MQKDIETVIFDMDSGLVNIESGREYMRRAFGFSGRFRPNLVVQPVERRQGFVEDTWIAKNLIIGDHARIRITGPARGAS